jgi:transcriptional regulator with XRE-family HTH domain
MDLELAVLGRSIVAQGLLRPLRENLGLTRTAMANLIGTNPVTYATWEERLGSIDIWDATAVRVARFYRLTMRQIDFLAEEGVEVGDLIPLAALASRLGVSQAFLLKRYREHMFEAEDLGVLGLWVHKVELAHIAAAIS